MLRRKLFSQVSPANSPVAPRAFLFSPLLLLELLCSAPLRYALFCVVFCFPACFARCSGTCRCAPSSMERFSSSTEACSTEKGSRSTTSSRYSIWYIGGGCIECVGCLGGESWGLGVLGVVGVAYGRCWIPRVMGVFDFVRWVYSMVGFGCLGLVEWWVVSVHCGGLLEFVRCVGLCWVWGWVVGRCRG